MWPNCTAPLLPLHAGYRLRPGAGEEAPSCLRYFCPTTLHPHPTRQPCLGKEVDPPAEGGAGRKECLRSPGPDPHLGCQR